MQLQPGEIFFEMQTLQSRSLHSKESQSVAHRHRHVEIIWIRRGKGFLDIGRRRCELADNTLSYIGPGQFHRLEIVGEAEGYIISFPERLINSGGDDFEMTYRSGLSRLLTRSPAIRVNQDAAGEIEDIAGKLYRELVNGYLLRSGTIKRYTHIFLLFLARQLKDSLPVFGQSRATCLVRDFIDLVDKRYMNWKRVKDYARELGVNANYLTEVVTRFTGYSAGQHIRQRIVLEAKRMATSQRVSMKEIAYRLGFDDIAHFSKLFKNVNGKNFTDFRNEHYSYSIGRV